MSQHHHHVADDISFAVITVSDSRSEENDLSGKKAIELIEGKGYRVTHYEIVKDDKVEVLTALSRGLEKADVIFFTGGTGIASRDITMDTIMPMFHKTIPGFGELFRQASFKTIGARAMLSAACAGIIRKGEEENSIVFCVPGSPGAVETALAEIILPAVGHIVWEARR